MNLVNFNKHAIVLILFSFCHWLMAQNVGVNTTGNAPASTHMFEVLQPSTTDNTIGIYVNHSGVSTTGYAFQAIKSGAGINNIAAYLESSGGTNNYALIIPNGGGNVGIGTTSPANLLQIGGTNLATRNFQIDANGLAVGRFDDNSVPNILTLNNRGITAINHGVSLAFGLNIGGAAAVSSGQIRVAAEDTYVAGANQDSYMTFGTTLNGTLTEKIRINSDGNVGIGTTTPAQKLEIVGNERIQGNYLEIGAGLTGNRNAYIDFVGDDTYTDYGLRIYRHNTGANAYSILYHRGTGVFYLSAQDAADVRIRTDNTDRLTIKPTSGNVGIGTTVPTQKLDVNGQIRLRTGATDGYLLQSDASGNGTWVNPKTSGAGLNFTPLTDGVTWYNFTLSGTAGGGEGEYGCSTITTYTITDPAVPAGATVALLSFRNGHADQRSAALKVYNGDGNLVAYIGQAGRDGDGRSFYSGGMIAVHLNGSKQFRASSCRKDGVASTWYYTVLAYQ